MAAWRGHVMLARRSARGQRVVGDAELLAGRCADLRPSVAPPCGLRGVRARPSTSRATSLVNSRPASDAKATARIRAPSRARALSGAAAAMQSSTSGSSMARPSQATRLRRIATRVGRSVGLISATRPAWKRSRRRSSRSPRGRAGRTVGGQHHLAARLEQHVEGVEELLLGAGLALEELDVVDQQHVDAPEAGLEGVGIAGAQRSRNSLVNASPVV